MSRCQIKVTITRVFDAEFDDAHAAANMFRTLEEDRQTAVLNGATGGGWKVQLASETHSVEPLRAGEPQ